MTQRSSVQTSGASLIHSVHGPQSRGGSIGLERYELAPGADVHERGGEVQRAVVRHERRAGAVAPHAGAFCHSSVVIYNVQFRIVPAHYISHAFGGQDRGGKDRGAEGGRPLYRSGRRDGVKFPFVGAKIDSPVLSYNRAGGYGAVSAGLCRSQSQTPVERAVQSVQAIEISVVACDIYVALPVQRGTGVETNRRSISLENP